VRRVAGVEPERAGIFPDHAVNCVRVHPTAFLPLLAVMFQRPKQGPVDIGEVP
jgi:hypothetical protein